MAKVIYFMSTGRCGTQFLARMLGKADQNTMVVHEGAGPNYKSATVFQSAEFESVISQTHQIRQQFEIIDQQLAAGGSYIDTGWPAYAWGPYFEKRFGAAFQFIHLLRNPFATAASMTTHALLGDGDDSLSNGGIIRPHQPNVSFPEFQTDYADFSYFERGLYHWLEVHSFLKNQHASPAFLGVFRFETLFDNGQRGLQSLWQKCGFDLAGFLETEPYDNFNVRARRGFATGNKTLLARVWALALALGYDQDLLETWSNQEFLKARYSRPRISLRPVR